MKYEYNLNKDWSWNFLLVKDGRKYDEKFKFMIEQTSSKRLYDLYFEEMTSGLPNYELRKSIKEELRSRENPEELNSNSRQTRQQASNCVFHHYYALIKLYEELRHLEKDEEFNLIVDKIKSNNFDWLKKMTKFAKLSNNNNNNWYNEETALILKKSIDFADPKSQETLNNFLESAKKSIENYKQL